ncbi:hypothetical protein H0H87_008947 [Tephrocybe sp. NHM501043]|nr:hypothetical protein H0H87_008947 [Tephrocybe sp. NHM501043]
MGESVVQEIWIPSKLLRLPPELLSHIFVCYKQLLNLSSYFSDGAHNLSNGNCDSTDSFSKPSNHDIRAILLLGSISRHLRKIAWNTPQLWSHISICISHMPKRNSIQIAGLSSWLARSGDVPLSIKLQYFPAYNSGQDATDALTISLAAMQVIMAHSSQWEELCVALPSECYTPFFEHARKDAIPVLKRLTLIFHCAWLTSNHFMTAPPITAPALNNISLINMPEQSSMRALPWGQIAHFRGSGLHVANVLDVIEYAAPNSCIVITQAFGTPVRNGASICNRHLRSLTLDGNARVFDFLTLSALEILCIRTDRALRVNQFVQFLQRSRCAYTLQSLDISVDFISPTDLLLCLHAVPGLTQLRVHNRSDRVHSLFGNDILYHLTFGKDHTAVPVPHLQRLEVLECSCVFDIEVLCGMLESRWDVCVTEKDTAGMGRRSMDLRRLDSFHLEASQEALSTVCKDVMHSSRVSRLIAEGMSLDVRFST